MDLSPTWKTRLWYLLPIVFSVVGGVAGFLYWREQRRSRAIRLLATGLLVLLIELVLGVALFSDLPSLPINCYDCGPNAPT